MAKIKKAMKGGSKVSKGKKGKKLLESDQVRLAPQPRPAPRPARLRETRVSAGPAHIPLPDASAPNAAAPSELLAFARGATGRAGAAAEIGD